MTNVRNMLVPIIIGVIVVLGIAMWFTQNKAVDKDENVQKAWSQVENQYQRRSDLIPNLQNTVKGYADFEQKTLTDVVNARASATQVRIDANNLTPENIQRFEQAQQGLSSALSRLLAVAEAYPNLKASEGFRDFQAQLEGTENRIAQERKSFNEAVNNYNAYIRKFPTNILAGMFGYSPKGYFQSAAGSEKAPEVKF